MIGPIENELTEIDVLWITAGLGCDGDTIAMTARSHSNCVHSRMSCASRQFHANFTLFALPVKAEPQAIVAMITGFGGTRIVDMLAGEQLPRIC